MKYFFTLLLFGVVTAGTLAQGNSDKTISKKPVYQITHNGVMVYYVTDKSDSGQANSSPAASTNIDVAKSASTKSDDVVIPAKPLDVIDVSPNPFKQDFAINIQKGFEGDVSIKIIDLLGNTAYYQKFEIGKEDNLIGVDLSNSDMKPGIYILRVDVNGTTNIMRIVKR